MNTQDQKPTIQIGEKRLGFQSVIYWLLIFLLFGFMLLPFVSAFNDGLTRLILSLKGYRVISEFIIPIEIKWVVVLLRSIGVDAYATHEYILIKQSQRGILVELIWNCVGWQSLIMFAITALVGIQSRFTFLSKVKAIILGLVGTIMINTIRVCIVILLFYYVNKSIGIVFHDYGALLTNSIWLFCFWRFVYSYVLEERQIK